jgi:hypothetical protein
VEVFGNDEQQSFVSGVDHFEDMRNPKIHWQNVFEEEKTNLINQEPYPPFLQNSFTYEVFEKMQKIGVLIPREKFEGNRAGISEVKSCAKVG